MSEEVRIIYQLMLMCHCSLDSDCKTGLADAATEFLEELIANNGPRT
jgi:hypothetical protein